VIVFTQTLRPVVNVSDRTWQQERADLEPGQGRPVTLSLVKKPADGRYACAWALREEPTIESYTFR
jgi:hypothetical protein